MLKKLLGAAAMAATAYAFVPAYAAHVHVGVGCSSENLAKAEGGVETMADGPGKFMVKREIAQAQGEMLSGKMSGCAMHLSRAMRTEVAEAPAEPAQPAWPQPKWGWKPLEGPR
jgi:hypothetical protein